ncbi:MAG: hypothetical protein KAF24_03820 [Nitrosopumilaceae archaeon]|nr:hypothetical protein [Nitrosopumilaceae archaeon]
MEDFSTLLNKLSQSNFPSAIGGCKNYKHNFDCCEYNITIFNDYYHDDIVIQTYDGYMIKLHHGSIGDTRSNILILCDDMKIINDPNWDLKIFLSKINKNMDKISNDHIKNCLINSIFYAIKTKFCIKSSDPYSPFWKKCSALFILDALLIINSCKLSPTHILEYAHNFKYNKINSQLSILNDCMGIERATTSLLSRMYKSTICLSAQLQKNDSKIIQAKYNYMIKNSLLSNCYLYLVYINRKNLLELEPVLHNNTHIYYMLKNGFDIENNVLEIFKQAEIIQNVANDLLNHHSRIW